jgi:hypothetical protein
MSLPHEIRFEPPPLYFMHIPKTAGLSLSALLRSAYRGRDVISLVLPKTFQQVSLADLKRYRCYLCHFGPGLFELVGRPNLPCITMLREPLERAVSAILYEQQSIKRNSPHLTPAYLELMQSHADADLCQWLEVKELRDFISNSQTRHLGILYDYRPYLKDGAIGSSGQLLQGPLRAEALTESQDMVRIAAMARQRLESMAVVGLTERFSESVELICDVIGIRPPARLPAKNIGPRKTSVKMHSYRATTPPDVIERIEAATAYDHELYAHACELFEQQLARYRARPRRTYSIAPRLRMEVVEPLRAGWHTAGKKWPGLTGNGAVQRAKNLFRRFF